ncbi:ArsA-related P-loop ATPase [Mariniluteicoccus flavus]
MSRELQIVTGKGGTGKSTVAAALAYAHAARGRRVLVCEVEGRPTLGDLFGVVLTPGREELMATTPAGGEVVGLSVEARAALMEYLDLNYHLGLAGKALERFGALEFATSIAPGLGDVLLTGKVYEAVRRGQKGREDAYDVVVLDAPPTGRIAQFLNVHEAVSGLARVGPIHAQARSIMELFRSDATVIHLTTLLEDLPVTETLEAVRELAATQIPLGSVVCTMVTPALTSAGPTGGGLTADEAARAAGGDLAVTGVDPAIAPALATTLAREAGQVTAEAEERAELAAAGLPMVDLPRLGGGVDDAGLRTLATLLDQAGLLDEAGPVGGDR